LRRRDEQDVLARLITVLEQYSLYGNEQQSQDLPEEWCRLHGLQMTRSKNGKHFYHKVGE
jgi:hypothetical protein